MKTIEEIKRMANKDVIDSMEGVVTKVFDPKEPTPAQVEHGIHTQIIELDGGAMYVKLLKKTIHIDKDFEGRKFRFESTKDANGNPGGLLVSKWQGSDGSEETSVDAWASASIYAMDGKPEQKQETKQKPEPKPEPKREQSGSGHIARYMRFHHACYKSANEEYKNEGLAKAELKDIATSCVIQFSRSFPDGLKEEIDAILSNPVDGMEPKPEPKFPAIWASAGRGKMEPKPEQKPKQETKPAAEPSSDWRNAVDSKGRKVMEMDKAEIIDLAIKVLPLHDSEKPAIKSVLHACMVRRNDLDLDYEEIYDGLDTILQSDFSAEAIQNAYNVIYTQFQQDNERACLEILKDQKLFRSFCQNHSK